MPPAKPANQPGRDIVVTTTFELIGVALLALLAGSSNQIGKIVVILMAGIALVWALSNTAFLQQHVGSWKPPG